MVNARMVLDSKGIKQFLKSPEMMNALMAIATDLKSDVEQADSSGATWIAEKHERPSRATVVIVPNGKDDDEAVAAKWTEVETGHIAKMLSKKSKRIPKFKKGKS